MNKNKALSLIIVFVIFVSNFKIVVADDEGIRIGSYIC